MKSYFRILFILLTALLPPGWSYDGTGSIHDKDPEPASPFYFAAAGSEIVGDAVLRPGNYPKGEDAGGAVFSPDDPF